MKLAMSNSSAQGKKFSHIDDDEFNDDGKLMNLLMFEDDKDLTISFIK